MCALKNWMDFCCFWGGERWSRYYTVFMHGNEQNNLNKCHWAVTTLN